MVGNRNSAACHENTRKTTAQRPRTTPPHQPPPTSFPQGHPRARGRHLRRHAAAAFYNSSLTHSTLCLAVAGPSAVQEAQGGVRRAACGVAACTPLRYRCAFRPCLISDAADIHSIIIIATGGGWWRCGELDALPHTRPPLPSFPNWAQMLSGPRRPLSADAGIVAGASRGCACRRASSGAS